MPLQLGPPPQLGPGGVGLTTLLGGAAAYGQSMAAVDVAKRQASLLADKRRYEQFVQQQKNAERQQRDSAHSGNEREHQDGDAVGVAQGAKEPRIDQRGHSPATLAAGGRALLTFSYLRHYASIGRSRSGVKVGYKKN